MLRQAEINNNIKYLSDHRLEPILLQTGLHDDAVRYFAPAVALNNFGEFLVYVAQTSMLCDLVKLKQKILVQVDFGNSRFSAELTLAQVPAPSMQCALDLTIVSAGLETLSDEKWCPLT